MFADGDLPLLLAVLVLLVYLSLKHFRGWYRGWGGYEASSDLPWTFFVASANSAAALCLIQAVLAQDLLYALLAVAIGGLLIISHK